MVDFELQRKNMVESQVRPSDVTDRRLIRAMLEIPREAFLPQASRPFAYMDEAVPLKAATPTSPARALMAPRSFAKLAQLAEIEPGDIVLDIGAATGYSAAVLANLGETVVALEADEDMAKTATSELEKLGIDNVVVVTGALNAGYASEGPFDAIVLEGAVERVGESLLDQLKDGGRLVAISQDEGVWRGMVWRRNGANFDVRSVAELGAPTLPGFEKPREFVF